MNYIGRSLCLAIVGWLFAFSALSADCAGIPTEISSGSNYISFGSIKEYLDSYSVEPGNGRGHFKPSLLKPVVGAYHLDPLKVKDQLRLIAESGQKLISLPIWFASIERGDIAEGYRNHYLNSRGGRLQQQQQHNIKQIIHNLRELKFETLIIRFIPQGKNSPYEWESFDQKLFDEDMEFIMSTVSLVEHELTGGAIRLLVDLGGEQGGNPKGANRTYVEQMWGMYCKQYSNCSESAYFSISAVPSNIQPRIRNLYEWMKTTGSPLPGIYAVDVYGYGGGVKKPVAQWDIYSQLIDIYQELRKIGMGDNQLLIQETFYHDFKGHSDIRKFVGNTGVKLMAIVQWPNSREVYGQFYERGIAQNWASEDYPFNDYCSW